MFTPWPLYPKALTKDFFRPSRPPNVFVINLSPAVDPSFFLTVSPFPHFYLKAETSSLSLYKHIFIYLFILPETVGSVQNVSHIADSNPVELNEVGT